jgi:hypothetical protein
VPGTAPSGARPAGITAANGRRRPSDEKAQRRVARAVLRSLRQTVRVNSAEHRPAARIEHGYYDLGSTRHVEHNPVAHDPAVVDAYSITCVCHEHQ